MRRTTAVLEPNSIAADPVSSAKIARSQADFHVRLGEFRIFGIRGRGLVPLPQNPKP